MAFDINITDNVAKLALSGDIDLQVSGDIKAEIERLSDVSRLEIDASEVSYIDSSGVAVLILARQYCARNNMILALPSISDAVHRVLQIAKLDVMLPIGEVVSAPEPEAFSFDDGGDAFGAGTAGDDGFGGDDDLVNSLLADDDPGVGPNEGADTAGAGDDNGGDFDGLDINAVDFSEPAAAPSTDAADEEPDPLPDSDALKPGTFS
jgi:anti-sigma B factor antagonist